MPGKLDGILSGARWPSLICCIGAAEEADANRKYGGRLGEVSGVPYLGCLSDEILTLLTFVCQPLKGWLEGIQVLTCVSEVGS